MGSRCAENLSYILADEGQNRYDGCIGEENRRYPMAIPHAGPMDVIDVRPIGARFDEARTATLVKTDELEVVRLVLAAGKEIPAHQVPGEITVQCLEGRVDFSANEVT